MSTRKCGCVFADANNTASVRSGYEMGGYLKEACPTHAQPEVELAACPDCGERDAIIGELWRSRKTMRFSVDCLACGRRGPDADSVRAAATSWNAESASS